MKGRILSGHRVSGKLHMGHLFGTLFNWVKLQDEYECFFEIADLHALTTDYEKTDELKRRIIDITKGWLACGLTLDKSTLFVQSRVSEHAELHLLFSMLVLVNRLERMPTLKEKIRDLNLHNRVNYGLLGYPVLQAADILVYKADAVPVGEDQLAHIEITREIARKFNSLYREVFPEPKALLTKFPRVPGIDGRRMAKSLQNSILIDDDVDTIKQKVMRAYTDPKKIYKGDVGHPDGCVVFAYHELVNEAELEQIRRDCTKGKLGCVDCKEGAAERLASYLKVYRDRMHGIKDDEVEEILEEGTRRAKVVAKRTLDEVKEAMKLL